MLADTKEQLVSQAVYTTHGYLFKKRAYEERRKKGEQGTVHDGIPLVC